MVRGRDGGVPLRALAGTRGLEHRPGAARDRQSPRSGAALRAPGDARRRARSASVGGPRRWPHRDPAGRAAGARRPGRRRALDARPGADHRREPAGRQGAGRRGLRRLDQRSGRARDRDHGSCRGDDAGQDPAARRRGPGAALALRALGRSLRRDLHSERLRRRARGRPAAAARRRRELRANGAIARSSCW